MKAGPIKVIMLSPPANKVEFTVIFAIILGGLKLLRMLGGCSPKILPKLDTSHGSRMVSPLTTLKVFPLEMKRGVGLPASKVDTEKIKSFSQSKYCSAVSIASISRRY